MKNLFFAFLLLFVTVSLAFATESSVEDYQQLKSDLIKKYSGITPREWGERVTGVTTHINGKGKKIALTFDACGGPRGSGFDKRLIGYLEQEHIPATLFINGRWIEANMETFKQLAANRLFEIENHGYGHRPASVNGKSKYGIRGTRNVGEVVDEIELNARRIQELTGKKPNYYRSGTAYYDEIAVKIAKDLGEEVGGFSVLGDAGATYTSAQVKKALLSAKPGDIIICHMNQPHSGTAQGVIDAVPELKKRGYVFVRLSDK